MHEPTITELFDLTGRTALISGATGHLGGAMATALAEAGASVVISSRGRDRGEEVARNLPTHGNAKHHAIAMDHKDSDSIATGFAEALTKVDQLDVLVCNGHSGCADDWTTISEEQFQDHLHNATGYFLLSRLMRDHAVERQQSAAIVLLGSMYAQVASYPDAYEDIGPASSVAYHTLKGGILHLTRHLAAYWAADRVRVNCLSPGPFPSPKAPPELVERLCHKSPMARMGSPHELKGALLLLVSDAGSYITGQNLIVDGGWTAW